MCRRRRDPPPPRRPYPGQLFNDEVGGRGVLYLARRLTPVPAEEDQPGEGKTASFAALLETGARSTDLSLCTQQEWLFRGDGVVPLAPVTVLQEKLCSVRSTLYIWAEQRGRYGSAPSQMEPIHLPAGPTANQRLQERARAQKGGETRRLARVLGTGLSSTRELEHLVCVAVVGAASKDVEGAVKVGAAEAR